ncbi:MAG TPA: acyl-CoA dehydrogenase family protein [Acidimicrobiia bacterium]|jgi:alkylation response protein AidB-like acyl-CoA dehydrogenase|nr:acyl-CoA dehydrogenase family protein [Acidimicrobiia bacterium]
MDFSWSDEQTAFRQSVVEFAQNELGKDLLERDARYEFSREDWNKCADFGIQGLPFPEEFGGQGADYLTTMLAMEALGYGCRDNGLIFSMNAHLWSGALPIWRFGNEDQQKKYLPGLIDGSLIAVQGMTEPGTGSDAYALATTATEDGDHYVLNGSKTFITNAPVADVFVVFTTVDKSKGWLGLTAFIVDADSPGLTVGKNFHKMGIRTSPMSELIFDDCRVPAENMLAKRGSGMMIFNHSIEHERGAIIAHAIGTMERQLEESLTYARQRKQFGQAIGKFQAVSHRLVDMKVRLEAARLLLYRLGWNWDQGTGKAIDASMVKLFLSEAWVQSSIDAMWVHGGYGYMVETELERDVRDAFSSRIYSGTNDIQKNVIAHNLKL